MATTVTLLTERASFAQQWQRALTHSGLASRVVTPRAFEPTTNGSSPVIIDADNPHFTDDELLTTIGYLRATGTIAVAHLSQARSEVQDLIAELCNDLVSRGDTDVARVAACLPRRLDSNRRQRFEFVTVSPDGNGVLAILGDGRTIVFARPLHPSDDGSAIEELRIDKNATTVTLVLESGVRCHLQAQSPNGATNGQDEDLIDGEMLGARLRELRLAAGLTQAELARRTGIHRPNIARVEAGRHTPSLETLSRIAHAMGVTTTQVLVSDSHERHGGN